MPAPKLDPFELRRLLEAGCSQAQAARHFGVSASAISQRAKQLRIEERRHPSMEIRGTGAMIINGEMSAPDQLAWVQRIINGELAWLLDEAHQPTANRRDIQKAILKCSAEVRQQSVVHTNLLRAITDRQLVRALQQAVVDAIAAEPRDVAQGRLKARRRHAVGLPALEGGSDVA